MPWPSHTRLAGDTDLFIRDLAYAADAALTSAVKMYVKTGTLACDANGDIIVDFGAAVTLTGCLVIIRGVDDPPAIPNKRLGYGRATNFPAPWQAYQTTSTCLMILPREFVPNQGKVYCRVATSVMALSNPPDAQTGRWYGSQPARGGTSIEYTAFGWVTV
jgi:hypothetical protein